MQRIKKLIFILIIGLLINPFFQKVEANNTIDIHFFHTELCSSCQAMEEYFNTVLLEEFDNINIIYYDIKEQENSNLMDEIAKTFGYSSVTPTIAIGGVGFSGHSEKIEAQIYGLIKYYTNNDYVDITKKIINNETILDEDFDNIQEIVEIADTIKLPIIGEIEIASLSTLLAAILIGFVDGLNPCAMWILVFLLSMLISMKNRKRMWLIGLTFLVTSALLYGIVMVLMSEVFVSFSGLGPFRLIVSLFALGFGIYTIYKFIRDRKKDIGCEVTNQEQRKGIINRINNIVKTKSLLFALIGTILLAVSVNLVELACTVALPAGFVSMLSTQPLSFIQRVMYIGIYVLFFLIDDLIIFTIALFTMNVTGISNKFVKFSNLFGGILMIIVGLLLILNVI